MGLCVSWPCFQGRSGGGYGATVFAICVQLARAGTWRPKSSDKSRMGYLPWLISYWLLWLNPRAQREHLTIQLSWVAAWLIVTRVCPVYLVKERCYFGGIYLSLRGRWAGKCGRIVSWEGGKSVWEEWGGNPANIRLDEDVLKTFWRRLSSSSSEGVFKTYKSSS